MPNVSLRGRTSRRPIAQVRGAEDHPGQERAECERHIEHLARREREP
jgi:hypothetical protein